MIWKGSVMPWIIVIFAIFLSPQAWADTSIFQQLLVLRFGQEKAVSVQDGTVDLRGLGNEEFFHVQGDVYLLPGRILDPKYLSEDEFQALVSQPGVLKAPLRLKTFPYEQEGTEATFGTYIIRFKNEQSRRLAINVPRLFHPLVLHYVDARQSERLIVHGELNQDPRKNRNITDMAVTVPVVEPSGDFYLYGQVTSPLFLGRNSLNMSSFYVGPEKYLNSLSYSVRFYATLVSGSFMIMAIFYGFIFTFRRQDLSSLYLAVFACCSFALSLFYVANFDITPQDLLNRFTVINLFGICSLQFYLLDKISFVLSKRSHRLLLIAAVLVTLGASVSVYYRFHLLIAVLFLLSFTSSTLLIFLTLYLGIKHRLSGITFFLLGTIGNSVFQFPIMIGYIMQSNRENGYNILLANFSMGLALALVNAKEFSVTYRRSLQQSKDLEAKNKEITYFNKNLERLVDHKTKEVRALLDYIPQGVLSVMLDGVVARDYSAHLKEILGRNDIGLQSFKELVLDRCDMSSDVRDQAWQTITASVGDLIFNYEVNSDKLPSELAYQHEGGIKYLKATWNTEVENESVVRILVTLLDVTAEKALEKEAEKQRKELNLIQELIAIPPNKIAQFFSTSLPLLKENERILSNEDVPLTPASIRMLFVNAHTVKGAARTLQLRDLARQIHDMEDHYADILKKDAPIDRVRLQEDVKASFAILEQYIDINRNKLNRSDNYNKVVIERDFIENHYFIIKDFVKDPPVDPGKIIRWLREQNEALTSLIFEQLPATFDGYKERAIKIARDIGRADPHFDFEIDDVSVAPDQKTVLDNCMVHLLRNALDHGIETPDERRRKQKPEAGTISVRTEVHGDDLTIKIYDDGRGLAMKKLKAKSEKLGLISGEATLEQIANTIFASGISTATEVTDISGRGVGMSAVQTFLEKARGSIEVKLGEPKDSEGEYYSFWFEIHFHMTPVSQAKAS